MDLVDQIQNAIEIGRAQEAKVLGKPFQHFRNQALIDPQYYVEIIGRSTKKISQEASISLRDIAQFDIACDGRKIQVGDVLQSYEDATDRYVIATKRRQHPIVTFRTDIPVFIRRPYQQTGNPEPYSGRLRSTNQILQYNNSTNTYSFINPGSGIVDYPVYAGKSQINYSGSQTPLKLPEDTRTSRWVFVTELFLGIDIQEADYIIQQTVNGTLYHEIYAVNKQIAGFHGQVLSADLVRP